MHHQKKRARPYPPVRWRPRAVAGTWRQRWWSAVWCPRPRWRGTCRSGSRTWWRPPTICPGSGCSRCCWSPRAPGRQVCPPPSDGRTSRRWCGRSRSRTTSPTTQSGFIWRKVTFRLLTLPEQLNKHLTQSVTPTGVCKHPALFDCNLRLIIWMANGTELQSNNQ